MFWKLLASLLQAHSPSALAPRLQELESLRTQLASASEGASKSKAELDRKLATAQEYIQRQLTERSEIEKKFHAMKDDLITRLQNACAQRDDARAQVGPGQGDQGEGGSWCRLRIQAVV